MFAGGFDLAAVDAVGSWELDGALASPSSLAALRSLIGKSLVHVVTGSDGDQRFALLETIREFALEQLRLEGEDEFARQRHYAIYLRRFRAADAHLRGPEATVWFARLQPEHDNLRAALRWTFDRALYSDAAWLIVAANWFWECCNHQYEASQWLLLLMPHYHTLAPDLRLAIWIMLNAYGDYTTEGAQMVDCLADEAMALLADCSHKLLQSAAWQVIAARLADSSRAAAAREHAIALARAAHKSPALGSEFCLLADRDFMLGFGLWKYALMLAESGELAQATALAHESLAIFQARENLYEQAGGFGTLGLLALYQGNLEQAHQLLVKASACATTNNTQWMVCHWQPLLGLVTLYRGEPQAARRLLMESWNACAELKRTHLLPRICIFLAETALWEGALDEAEHWLAQGMRYRGASPLVNMVLVNYFCVAARLAVARQAYSRAAMLFGLAEVARVRAHCVLVEPVIAQVEAALATTRTALEPTLFAEAFAAGQQMPLTEAFLTLLAAEYIALNPSRGADLA